MKYKLLIVALLFLVLITFIPTSQARAYEWKDGWIDKLEREAKLLKWKIKGLTFELGDDMLVPVADLLFYGLDCDDAALYMYLHFTALGYKVDIIQGNLEKTNETKSRVDHIWVLVHSGNQTFPYDFGYYCNDDQHFEGYLISYKKLLSWAITDQ